MPYSSTVLIIPTNDAEAILIAQLADAMGLPVIRSGQTHGASLDKGRDVVPLVKKGKYKKVIVVEMPGPKTEARIKKLGVTLKIIDHHHYTGLDRAHDPKSGKMLMSSLEQFLSMFKINKTKLKKLGFDHKFVLGIGILDRGYIWALQDSGYSDDEIRDVLAFHDELVAPLRNQQTEKRKEKLVKAAWKRRKKWREFYIVETGGDIQLRPRLSRLVAVRFRKPTPLIIIERKRRLIYVQESEYAMDLFRKFGGFTFGLDRNWGYRNESKTNRVTLKNVKRTIEQVCNI